MTQSDDTQKIPEKTANVIVTVEDGGQFGFNNCGECGARLEGYPSHCPMCGVKLEGSKPGPSFGGSDF